MSTLKFWQAINTALREEMQRDPAVCLVGEDVARAGGPFGATRGLLEAFGPNRVRDTPISEAAIVGLALGAAMTGLRPVVEIMFMDFLTLVMDQLVNQAAKVHHMSGGRFRAPMVVRTICGGGAQTGPQHGQNLEAWLAHVPGLKVVYPGTPGEAHGLLKAAIRDDGPVIVVESLSLWGLRGEVAEGDGVMPLGQAAVLRSGADVTLVSWGSALQRTQAAAEELAAEGVAADVISLRSISPPDTGTILASLARTGRLVIVHDAVGPFGAGAELAALAAGPGFPYLKAPVERVAAPFSPAPFSPELEAAYFPQPAAICAAVRRTLAGGTPGGELQA